MKILCILLTLLLVHPSEARSWVDSSGRSFEGTLKSKSDDWCLIQLPNGGNLIRVKLNQLSGNDAAFVRSWKSPEIHSSEKVKRLFNQPWPKVSRISSRISVKVDQSNDGKFHYVSENFRFIANTKLSPPVVSQFALIFESTHNYISKMPLGNLKPMQKKKLPVYLVETQDDYLRAGGPQGSGGVYFGNRDLVMVPYSSLGLFKRGKTYGIDPDRTNETLAHEIVHQLTDPIFYGPSTRGWYTEGIAQYVAFTPYRHGSYSGHLSTTAILKGIAIDDYREKNGFFIGNRIVLPRLKTFMNLPYDEFTGNRGIINYGGGTLLVTYLAHFRGRGDAADFKRYLEGIRAGKHNHQLIPEIFTSYEALEKDFKQSMKRRGVEIVYTGR